MALLPWCDDSTDNIKHAHGARFLEIDPLHPKPSPGQKILRLNSLYKYGDVICPDMTIDVKDRANFETEPFAVQLSLPPVGTTLGIHLLYDETYRLTYVNHVDQYTAFGRAFPPNFRRSVYVLSIEAFDPIMVDDVLAAFKSSQSANAGMPIQVWLVKRNSATRTDIEEQRMMFDQVSFVPVQVPALLAVVSFRAVTSLIKPDCTAHIGQMMKSPFKADFKGAHFENYEKMYSTGTWSFPVIHSLIPAEAALLPIRPAYAVESTSTESLWEIQVRSCVNGARMQQDIHYDESFAPVASIESTHVLLCLAAAQGKQVFILDVRNAFQNTIQFDAQKRTYNMIPPFFSEYLCLHWPDRPNLETITTDSHLYTIQNFRSMQGQKDAGRLWHHLLKGAFENIGLHRSVADHPVFVWK
jgi:hypothetical protein